MIRLTTEQAQQIEVALLNWKAYVPLGKVALWDESDEQALATIRAARAQADHIAGADKMVVPNGYALVSIDALKVWGKYDEVRNACQFPAEQAAEQEQNSMFMEGYRIGLAEMREKCAKVVTEHAPTCSPHWVSYVVAIRAIKFEGDTGFRPVSEMVAEHKQDPKKAAAIEKAKMRKEEQEPVPTGATHYQPHQKTYYKRVSATEWYLWSCTGKGWLPSKGTSDSSEWIMLSPIQAHQPAKPAEQEPVAWRVRGYNQFKTGNPAPWRYVDGTDKPTVNMPDCCDFEPLYAAPVQQAEQEPVAWMWACTECGTELEDDDTRKYCNSCGYNKFYKSPRILRQEPVSQEPVAHMYPSDLEKFETNETYAYAYSVAVGNPDERSVPLYTDPPRREWVEPSDEQITKLEYDCFAEICKQDNPTGEKLTALFIRRLLKLSKELNNG